jgi:flagellar hook-associated protein 1 FlgK
MRSTFHGLEIGRRALFAQQAGLNTVGQNVANANTPGYSRQRVNYATTPSMEYPGLAKSAEAGQIGTGVYVESIERVREAFLDAQYRNENKASGEWEVRRDTLDKLQAIFNEPSDTGLSHVLNEFFLAWQKLGNLPHDINARSVVAQKASDLASTFANLDAKLSELDGDLAENVDAKVQEFNTLTQQIFELNKQINTLEVLGDKANDLRDRRDYLVDRLSNIANITAREADGVYTVSIGDTVVVSGLNPPVQISYDAKSNTTSPPILSGQIAGMTAARSEYLKVYRDQLDSLVNGLVNGKMELQLPSDYEFPAGTTTLPFRIRLADGTVMEKGTSIPAAWNGKLAKGTFITFEGLNGLHEFGYTLHSPAKKAGKLFETADGSNVFTARNIRLSQDIKNDIRNIASSTSTYQEYNSDGTKGDVIVKVGNGDIALMMGEAVNAVIDFKDGLPPNGAILTTGTVSGYMRAMVGQLGIQADTAERQVKNQETLLRQIDNRRQSISGVSIDEEMANMIRFQQSYNAAARIISTIDSMLDVIVNQMKR